MNIIDGNEIEEDEKYDGGGDIINLNHKILDNSAAQLVQDLLEYRKEHN